MLPKIPYSMEKNKSVTIPIGNLNLSSNFKPGDIADSYGISARKYPYITTRRAVEELPFENALEKKISDIYTFFGTVYVCDDVLYWIKTVDGEETTYNMGAVKSGKKQFIPINTKLVILPDKVYLDSTDTDPMAHCLAERYSGDLTVTDAAINRTVDDALNDESNSVTIWGKFAGNRFTPMVEEVVFGDESVENFFYAMRDSTGRHFTAVLLKGTQDKIQYRTMENRYYAYEFTEDIELSEGNYVYYPRGTQLSSAIYAGTKNAPEGNGKKLYLFDSPIFGIETESTCTNAKLYQESTDVTFHTLLDTTTKYAVTFGGRRTYGLFVEECQNWRVEFNSPVDIGKSSNWIEKFKIAKYREFNADDEAPGLDGKIIPENWVSRLRFSCSKSPNDDFWATALSVSSFPAYSITIDKNFIPDGGIYSVTIYYAHRGDTVNFTDLFKVGDTVVAKSSYKDFGEKTFTITALTPGSISTSANIFTPGEYPDVTIEQKFPDLDFACECHNRLFGCSNADKTIYVSALGDPTNMMTYEGVSTDSFAVAVAGEGDFTACCAHDSSVLFWKERQLHKLTGYNPSDFALYTYQVEGVQAGSERSAQIINEVLYYKGVRGVFAYTGGIPQLISPNFGERKFRDAVGGSDGDTYYISMSDADGDYLFAYETRSNMWVLEDKIKCDSFVKSDGSLKYVSGGKVYMMTDNEDPLDLEWMAQFVPFYETIEGKKTYSRLLMRAELPKGSYMIIEVRSDDGPWCEAGKIVGANKGIIPIRLPIARCDKFEIRLSGKGAFVLHEILREYHVGSEV